MKEIKLDKRTRTQVREIKAQVKRLEDNIVLLVTGFMNAKGRDSSKYKFSSDFTKLELIEE